MTGTSPDDGWVNQAACRDQPVRRFTHPAGPDDVHTARATCATCTVRETCLAVALAHPAYADAGIWGGTTAAQRRHIRQGRRTVTDIRQEEPSRQRAPQPTAAPAGKQPSSRPSPAATGSAESGTGPHGRRPRLPVSRDQYGDYTDASGRVIIFQIFGQPPYMLMIDRRPIVRTATIREAAERAWTHLHAPDRTTPNEPREDTDRRDPCHLEVHRDVGTVPAPISAGSTVTDSTSPLRSQTATRTHRRGSRRGR